MTKFILRVFGDAPLNNTMKSFEQILQDEPNYRLKQIKEALFDCKNKGWADASNLPKGLREKLEKEVPWMSIVEKDLKTGKDGSQKALLQCGDGNLIETVLMENSRGGWTICVSSQAGCPMGCAFCQTGKTGFKRNLAENEIADQYRYWADKNKKIGNVVVMGMGEPFLNYKNVRGAISDLIKYAGIGPNHITVSTVGIIEKLNHLLEDENWPDVRLAVSLHSAENETRKKLIPSHSDDFFERLEKWSMEYLDKRKTKSGYLSFEYILIKGINDDEKSAKRLADFLRKIKKAKVNLILFNEIPKSEFLPSDFFAAEKFQNLIKNAGFVCTIRKSLGADIAAACGQLAGRG